MTGPKNLDSYTGVPDSNSLNYIYNGIGVKCCKLRHTLHESGYTGTWPPLAVDQMGSDDARKHPQQLSGHGFSITAPVMGFAEFQQRY
jgi:hypothetical protein